MTFFEIIELFFDIIVLGLLKLSYKVTNQQLPSKKHIPDYEVPHISSNKMKRQLPFDIDPKSIDVDMLNISKMPDVSC